MVSKSINSDTISAGHRTIQPFGLADSLIPCAIVAIFLLCHKFQILNAVILFVLVLMIHLQAFRDKPLL